MRERKTVADLAGLRAAYNETYARAEYGERAALYDLVWRLLEPTGGLILDVGCGTAPFTAYAAERDARVLGLDLADNALRKAHERGLGPLAVAQGERLPLRSDSVVIWR